MNPDEPIRLLSQLQPALYAYILTLHPNRVDAEDILQETNVTVWKKLSEFEPGTNFRAWVFRIAYFQTLAERKRLSRKPTIFELDETLLKVLADEAEIQLEGYDERSVALKGCLSELRTDDTRILRRHYVDETPIHQIAAEIGRSAVALRGSLLRIRRLLRTCIERKIEGLLS